MAGTGRPAGATIPAHRMRRNDREWTPAAVVFFDTETLPEDTPGGQKHTLALWHARLDVRRPYGRHKPGTYRAHGTTREEFAAQLAEWCRGTRSVWGYAHNLGFDLTILALPDMLPRAGWTVTRQSLITDSPWISFAHKAGTLTLADSARWLRKTVAEIGAAVGLPKLDMPAFGAPPAQWDEYCQRDTDIIAAAMLTIMDWWDKHRCGNWALTGSAAGWNYMRHITPGELPFIVHDDGAADDDRAAVYGGMRGVARTGDFPDMTAVEMDFRRAYTVIPARLPVPHQRAGTFTRLDPQHRAIDAHDLGVIAECEVSAGVPRWPCRDDGHVLYPVGRFTTTLASPEIAEARARGELAGIGPGRFHQLAPWLSPWAQRCLDLSGKHARGTPPAVQIAAKHWGRAVPGKFAQRGFATLMQWDEPGAGFRINPWLDLPTGRTGWETVIGGRGQVTAEDGNGDNAYPAVLAWIEAHVRIRLNRVMDKTGRDVVLAWDTDGVTIPAAAARPYGPRSAVTAPLALVKKGTLEGLSVMGPQAVWAGEYRKLSGIPRSAELGDDGQLHAQVWPSLRAAANGGTEGEYTVSEVTYQIPRPAAMGWILADGTVEPPRLYIGACGHNHARRPPGPGLSQDGRPLGPDQSAAYLSAMDGLYPASPECEDGHDGPVWPGRARQGCASRDARDAARAAARERALSAAAGRAGQAGAGTAGGGSVARGRARPWRRVLAMLAAVVVRRRA